MCLSIVSKRIRCELAGHKSETNRPVVLWVFLFALFNNGGYVFPFLISGNFTGLTRPHIWWIIHLVSMSLSFSLIARNTNIIQHGESGGRKKNQPEKPSNFLDAINKKLKAVSHLWRLILVWQILIS